MMSWISGMKCVCGYTYREKHEGIDVTILDGDDPFSKIEGTFLLTKQDCEGFDRQNKTSLYMCPKCGTMRCSEVWQNMEDEA